MIDLTKSKDPSRVLKNALEPGINAAGTHIAYHEGDYADQINSKPVGRMAWDLMKSGRVHLFQKMLHTEPRRYQYLAVVR